MTRAQVTRVLFEGTRAAGVEWGVAGQGQSRGPSAKSSSRPVRFNRRSCCSCPASAAALLKRIGIDPVVDLPGVGENLQDHYQGGTIVRCAAAIAQRRRAQSVEARGDGLEWLFGPGPLTVGAGQVGGAACTRMRARGRPDVQFNVMPLSVDKPGAPLHRYSGFTAAVWQCHPASRGHVRIRRPIRSRSRASTRTI